MSISAQRAALESAIESLKGQRAATAVTVPSIVEVFGGRPAEAWLAREVASGLTLGTAWSVAASIGTAMRLRKPMSERTIDDLLDEATTISLAAKWIEANPGVAESLKLHARHEADMLIDGLDLLADSIVGCDDGAKFEAIQWTHRRDDLESVCVVLETHGVSIRGDLADVDREAGIRQEMWAFMERVEDRRLAAVSRCEPDSWWGHIAEEAV